MTKLLTQGPVQELDFRILNWIQQNLRTPFLDRVMPAISLIGNAGTVWIIIALICVLYGWRKGQGKWLRCGAVMIAGLLLWGLVGQVILKNLVARPRPCWLVSSVTLLVSSPSDYSFPSGHTAASFVSSAVLIRHDRRLGIAAYVLGFAIAFSRLYLYVHFPSDVLAGAILGTVIGIVCFHGSIRIFSKTRF